MFTSFRNAAAMVVCSLFASEYSYAQSTHDIWNHHIQAWTARSADGIVADYSDDSVLVVNNQTYPGIGEIRNAFTQLFKIFDNGQNRIDTPTIFDRIVYITWHFTPNEKLEQYGTDTFVIEKGKIVFQTIASPLYDLYPIAHAPIN